MVLTIASALSIALGDDEESRTVLIFAALGSNAAWGMVDGVMYVLTSILERGRYARIVSSIRSAKDKAAALESIQNELDSTILQVLDEEQREHVYADVLRGAESAESSEVRMTRDDVFGAFASFLLVFVSTFPVLIPFLIVGEVSTA